MQTGFPVRVFTVARSQTAPKITSSSWTFFSDSFLHFWAKFVWASKGVCQEIVYLHFFLIPIHLGPYKRAKVFSNLVSISQRQSPQNATHGGVKGIKFRKKTPRCATYRGDYLRAHCRDDLSGVQHTAATISQNTAESRAPSFKKNLCPVHHTKEMQQTTCERWSQQCATHGGDDLQGVQHTILF